MLNKESEGYRENGLYEIEGENWMSIWTYKNHNNIIPNDSEINAKEGKELNFTYDSMESKPDFGRYNMVLLFIENNLATFYN